MAHSHVSDELLHLRKRARRRLVGAVALVLFALTVLWTALDNAPPARFSTGNPVEIVSSAAALTARPASVVAVVDPAAGSAQSMLQASAAATAASVSAASALASAPVAKPAQAPAVASAAEILPGRLVNHNARVAPARTNPPAAAAKPKPAAQAPSTFDPKKILEGQVDPTEHSAKPAGKYFVQIGAFADAAKVRQLTAKLRSAGLPVLVEKIKTSKGELTRVRVGPAADNAKAEAYRKKAGSLGVPGKVIK